LKKNRKVSLIFGCVMLTVFVLWTFLISFVDCGAIGPKDSEVGFSALNGFIHKLTGVNMTLYIFTDWLGLVPICITAGFGLLGLYQWIKRKSIFKVDYSIRILGVFYVVVFALFFLFEILVINYRPVLIEGVLESSYPSSTTLLVMCVMPTAYFQFKMRIRNIQIRNFVLIIIAVFSVFMIIGRIVAGVHWITDIIGGVLLSLGLVSLYYVVCKDKM